MPDERAALDAVIAEAERSLSLLLSNRLVADLVARVKRAGRGNAGGVITPVGRQALSQWLPTAIAALFGATPAEAEALYATKGTVPRVLALSTQLAAYRAVQPVVADVTARLAGQPGALASVTGQPINPRPPIFDPTRSWVDPAGHKLSDRIWMGGEDLRSRIDGILDYHIQRGTNAVEVGRELELYLTYDGRINAKGQQVFTRTPYGNSGLARPRTLARTEISRAYGAATTQAAALNPFVAGLKWRLSASHPQMDQCDQRASADPNGLGKGVYPVDSVPRYPDHPNCLCTLSPKVRDDSAAVIAAIMRGGVPGGLDTAAIVSAVSGF